MANKSGHTKLATGCSRVASSVNTKRSVPVRAKRRAIWFAEDLEDEASCEALMALVGAKNFPDFVHLLAPHQLDQARASALLREAVKRDARDEVELLWPYAERRWQQTFAVSLASTLGHVELVKRLISRSDVRAVAHLPLRNAISEGHIGCVEALLPHASKIGIATLALPIAAEYGLAQIVEMLIASDLVDPEDTCEQAMDRAAEQDHLALVRRLAGVAKASGRTSARFAERAIRIAVKHGHAEILAFLLGVRGDRVDLEDTLLDAFRAKRWDCVFLLQAHCDQQSLARTALRSRLSEFEQVLPMVRAKWEAYALQEHAKAFQVASANPPCRL